LEIYEEAKYRTVWRTGFGGGYVFVLRQIMEDVNG
jgi:hypothetical protein